MYLFQLYKNYIKTNGYALAVNILLIYINFLFINSTRQILHLSFIIKLYYGYVIDML